MLVDFLEFYRYGFFKVDISYNILRNVWNKQFKLAFLRAILI